MGTGLTVFPKFHQSWILVSNSIARIYSASQNLILFCRKDQAARFCPSFGTGSYQWTPILSKTLKK
ncbi:hypothetical protein EHQ97_13910 [Leptospira adleri]|nr:hypothetical protein EHQ97_13910 [Leptospira adleri]